MKWQMNSADGSPVCLDRDAFINELSKADFPKVRNGGRNGKENEVYNIPAAFDIETTSFYTDDGEKQAIMYAWVFGICGVNTVGRTWEEFEFLLSEVVRVLDLNAHRRLYVYVHNLAFEFQFICKRFTWEKVFCVDTRKPIYARTTFGIEFRCSYLLSGYNLATLGKNLTKYKQQKMVGDLNYKLARHAGTPLSYKEWGYILADSMVVQAYIQELIEQHKSIVRLPTTNTGFVRQFTRKNCMQGKGWYEYVSTIQSLTMTVEDYEQLARAFTGGFTHANVKHVNKVHREVASYDFTSSYPAVMLAEQFPMSAPVRIEPTEQQFYRDMEVFACVFDVDFYGIVATASENYISESRCFIRQAVAANNGRVISARHIKLTVTEVDFELISQMYEWDDMTVSNFMYMRKAPLPKKFIQCILKLYGDKTTLKGVEGKEAEYLVSKGMLNSLYGMTVTNPCKDDNTYKSGQGWVTSVADIEKAIGKYNRSRMRFLYYAWGVYVTAYARRNLFTGIMEFGDDYIYSDTDSIKVLHHENHQEYFKRYNKDIIAKIQNTLKGYDIPVSAMTPKTIKGVSKPIGVWDFEGVYDEFKTLGAKRYIYTQDGKLHTTIAGVGKSAGAEFLSRYKHPFEKFREGLEFPAGLSGKMTHTYIDYEQDGVLTDYLGNDYHYNEKSSTHLEDAAYKLTIDNDFKDLFERFMYHD